MPILPRRAALDVVKGALMGAAEVIPGVSGGTVAVLVGVYERLIVSIRLVASGAVALLRGDARGAVERVGAAHWSLLVPLLAGMAAAVVLGAFVLVPLVTAFPEASRATFFGLIVASLVLPWRRVRRRGASRWAAAGLGAVAAFVLAGLPEGQTVDPALPRVAASAAVAICAMILPGVSGAYLLTVMGMYEASLDAIRSADVTYVVVFVVGAAVGLGLFAKLLEALLERWRDLTMAAITGLMAGALRALWPWLAEGRELAAPPAEPSAALVVALGAAAFAILRVALWASARGQATAAQ